MLSPLIIFSLVLFLLLGSFSNASHAKPRESSLVLGLSRSRSTSVPFLGTKVSKPQEVLDMLEPLRSFRDGYLISLNLGTPQQVIQVYMDTGSDLSWVPCGSFSFECMDCDDFRNYKLAATYSPSSSSSSFRDLCWSPHCLDVHSSDDSYDPCTVAGCSLATLVKGTCPRPCPPFSYTYGAGGLVIGTLSKDTLRVHGNSNYSGAMNEVSNFTFGCVTAAYREPVGIVGFGKGPLSLPSQLGFLHKGFSHCFLGFKFASNPNITSPLIIGDAAISYKEYFQFTPLLSNPLYRNYYYIGLKGITVGNSSITVPPSLSSFDSEGNGGTLIDSGTTYTHLPDRLYSQLLSIIIGSIIVTYPRSIEHETRTGFDLCYKVPYLNSSVSVDSLPSISFQFLNNVTLTLPKDNYFYPVSAPSNFTVVKCLLFQSMEEGDSGPAGIFGSFQQQNVEVVYDLQKERIGFQPTDCASSAAFHGLRGH